MELDGTEFAAKFNREEFLVRHHLADHPLFSLARLVELAQKLPEENVKYTSGDVAVAQGLYKGPRNGLSIADTIRQIEECRSWMVLKFVETDPEYKVLLDQCLDEIGEHSEKLYPGMRQRAGFIFVSSPDSVTPYHIDPEFNFLLQVRGEKFFHIWNVADRAVLTEDVLEQNYVQGGGFHLPFEDEFNARAKVYTLQPGSGLHVPVSAPHWVRVGGEVSISFSITFHTPWTERREMVYNVNGRLRRFGLKPTPFGRSSLRDSVKFNTGRIVRKAGSMLGSKGSA